MLSIKHQIQLSGRSFSDQTIVIMFKLLGKTLLQNIIAFVI